MEIKKPLKNQYDELKTLWKEAFSDTDEFLETFFTTSFSADRSLCVIKDKKVVAALYWFECIYNDKKIAYIYAVATLKSYRGQGICNHLITKTHQHLKNLGFFGALLVPGSKKLFDFYEKMGYKTCSFISEYSCDGAPFDSEFEIRKIDKYEYAKLRREFLPRGSVLQENENLDFLDTSACFYTGTDFLAALQEQEGSLYIIELLGNIQNAEKIAGALGYKKCKYRTIGQDRPFAMYYSLQEDGDVAPKYFGLAFD